MRLLEADGSATAAMNPIDLYLVVTNNLSAGDLQEYIWRLPMRVAKVRSVKRIQSGILISATQGIRDSGKTRETLISVRYQLNGSKINTALEVDYQ